ncbi:hypothetical protein M9H77_35418 [Catharanthus roseus]|uniref:Uncharacterized protein n=1 Tax=Catharanthus roseus TaxID=4058 RepID=A0ACB9ZP98_CATRO|nr:hypothetical protein M9H77_35418 [Catharanthus roseus]
MEFGFRGDDDLGHVIDRTSRVEGLAVTASSHGVRGCHSTSDIPSTSAPIGPGMTHPPTTLYYPYTPVPYDPYGYSHPPQTSYDSYAHAPSLPIRMPGLDTTQYFSRTQILLNKVSGPGLQVACSCVEASSSGHRPTPGKGKGLTCNFISVMSNIVGSQQKRPKKSRPPTNPTQRKKSNNDGWEQTGPANEVHRIQSLSLRIAVTSLVIYGSDLDISDSNIGINGQDLPAVAKSPRSGLSTEQGAACYVFYLLGSSIFTDKSGNNGAATLAYLYRILGQTSRVDAKELSGYWSLLEDLEFGQAPPSVQLPTTAPITPHVLLDMIARYVVVTWLMGIFLCIQFFYNCNRKSIKHHKPETH